MLNLEKIGQKIADVRAMHGMTQAELADALFVTHQAVSKWENGKSLPSIDLMYQMTQLFEISVDVLLDDSEIRQNDYSTMLRLYPRKAVISRWLEKANPQEDIDGIFYLLSPQERAMIIDRMISGHIGLKPEDIWHLLSKKERIYLLGVIVSKKYRYDLTMIYHRLSDAERMMIKKQDVDISNRYIIRKH